MLWTPALHVLIFPEHFLYCVHYLTEACIKSQSGYYSYPPLTKKESEAWKVLVQDKSKDLNPILELNCGTFPHGSHSDQVADAPRNSSTPLTKDLVRILVGKSTEHVPFSWDI